MQDNRLPSFYCSTNVKAEGFITHRPHLLKLV